MKKTIENPKFLKKIHLGTDGKEVYIGTYAHWPGGDTFNAGWASRRNVTHPYWQFLVSLMEEIGCEENQNTFLPAELLLQIRNPNSCRNDLPDYTGHYTGDYYRITMERTTKEEYEASKSHKIDFETCHGEE
jgi:hypothetical protein